MTISYTFHCDKCNINFDKKVMSIGVYPKHPVCPRCGKKDTRKIIHGTPVIFIGDGFTKRTEKKD